MRVIRMELIAKLRSEDKSISLASDELRKILFQQLESMDLEITDVIRQRASSYLPANYSVFARTHLEPEGSVATTELWIVDPTIRWPFGLLTRSAWKLLAPLLAHVVRESFESRLQNVSLDVDPNNIKVMALTPTRTWRDPMLLSILMVILTSAYWLYLHGWIKGAALLQ
jgi:hypothetical protein